MKPHPWLVVVFVGALVGLVFAAVSTYDFVQHLDRQVHSLHCSFIPGGGHDTGESGCQVAMMSSYSSVLRTRVWGGIPISLPAMAVFAFLGVFSIDLLLTRRKDDRRATAFLALASALPALTSLVMLVISLSQLGTTCKLCVCIYTGSALCLIGSIGLWRRAVRLGGAQPVRRVATRRKPSVPADIDLQNRGAPADRDPAWVGASKEIGTPKEAGSVPRLIELGVAAPPPASDRFLAAAFGVGVGFVLVPILVYLAMAPDHGRFIGTCDGLTKPDDTYHVMVDVARAPGGAPAIEILDPLCPACKAFEDRLERSGFAGKLDRRAILFPLDNTCNWMVTEATHPGACTVSEAVLCAGDRAPQVIAWAFDEQDRVRAETKADPAAAARIVKQRFPELAACVGSPEARSRLNKSMRWAVANNIRVLTPQLFIDNVKLCDEDVDLGLEYSLRVMLDRHEHRTLVVPAAGTVGTPVEAAPHEMGKPAGEKPRKPEKSEKPAGEKPAGEKPAGEKPASEKPASEKPASEKPASEKPVPEAPAADKPAADKPATDPDKPAAAPDQPVTSPGGAP